MTRRLADAVPGSRAVVVPAPGTCGRPSTPTSSCPTSSRSWKESADDRRADDGPRHADRGSRPAAGPPHRRGPQRPECGEWFESTNPATLAVNYRVARGNAADVDRAVTAAARAFEDPSWRDLSQTRRGRLLRRLGDLVGENAEELARMETLDNGKLLREMRGQLATLPEYLYYYAGLADKVQGDVIPTSDRRVLNYTTREPLGVVGAITPWNSPAHPDDEQAGPRAVRGNTIVVKPSEHTSATVLRLAELAVEAGFPPGVVNVVTGSGPRPARRSSTTVASPRSPSRAAPPPGAHRRDHREPVHRLHPGTRRQVPNIVFGTPTWRTPPWAWWRASSPPRGRRASRAAVLAPTVPSTTSCCNGSPTAPAHPDRGPAWRRAPSSGPLAFADQRAKVDGYVADLGARRGPRPHGRPATDGGGLGAGSTNPPSSSTSTTRCASCGRRSSVPSPPSCRSTPRTRSSRSRTTPSTAWRRAFGRGTCPAPTGCRPARRRHRLGQHVPAMSPMSPRQGFKSSGVGVEHGQETIRDYTRVKSVWINTARKNSPTRSPCAAEHPPPLAEEEDP